MVIAPCPVTGTTEQSLAPSSGTPWRCWYGLMRFPGSLPFSRLLPAPTVSPHQRDAPDPSSSLWPLLDPLQQLLGFFVLKKPRPGHSPADVPQKGELNISCIKLSEEICAFIWMEICVRLSRIWLYSSTKKSGLNLVPTPWNPPSQTAVIKQSWTLMQILQ